MTINDNTVLFELLSFLFARNQKVVFRKIFAQLRAFVVYLKKFSYVEFNFGIKKNNYSIPHIIIII